MPQPLRCGSSAIRSWQCGTRLGRLRPEVGRRHVRLGGFQPQVGRTRPKSGRCRPKFGRMLDSGSSLVRRATRQLSASTRANSGDLARGWKTLACTPKLCTTLRDAAELSLGLPEAPRGQTFRHGSKAPGGGVKRRASKRRQVASWRPPLDHTLSGCYATEIHKP